MAVEINKETYRPYIESMEKSIRSLDERLAHLRAGRANPRVLDALTVDYYGVQTPLSQVASITVPEARSLLISPWDASLLKAIEKSILASDLGLNPANDGKVIRLSFPPLTEERRHSLVKQAKEYGEDAKVSIRNIRRDFLDAMKKLKKANQISEDLFKGTEEEIQKITDQHTDKVNKCLEIKEKELLEI